MITKLNEEEDPEKTQTLIACLDFLEQDATVRITDNSVRKQLDLVERGANEEVGLLTTKDVIQIILDTTKSSSDYSR